MTLILKKSHPEIKLTASTEQLQKWVDASFTEGGAESKSTSPSKKGETKVAPKKTSTKKLSDEPSEKVIEAKKKSEPKPKKATMDESRKFLAYLTKDQEGGESNIEKPTMSFDVNKTFEAIGGMAKVPDEYKTQFSYPEEINYEYLAECGFDIEKELKIPTTENTNPTKLIGWNEILFKPSDDLPSNQPLDFKSIKVKSTRRYPNDDWRGVHPIDLVIPWPMKGLVLRKPSMLDVWKAMVMIKSHKSELTYEMFTGSRVDYKDPDNPVIYVDFDYGS